MNDILSGFKFNDLLPSSIKDDPKFVAASACLDKLFDGFDDRVKKMLVYSRIDELAEPELDDLAWQWNIGYYEGYSLAANIEEKRGLVKHAIQLHWHKGTRWALERVGEILNMPLTIIEWFENDATGSGMEPYEFDIHVDAGIKGASPTFYADTERLVNNLKNVRSVMRKVQQMISIHRNFYMDVGGAVAEFKKVFPLINRRFRNNSKMYFGLRAYGAISGATGVIPEPEEVDSIKVDNLLWTKKNLDVVIPDDIASGVKSWDYDNNVDNRKKYGRLYTWQATKKAIEQINAKWRLPTRQDYTALYEAVGGSYIAGKVLKSKTGWDDNGNGTDDFGFAALPGGAYFPPAWQEPDGSFGFAGTQARWWTDTEWGSGRPYYASIHRNDDAQINNYAGTSYGFSVRLVKDI